MARKRSHCPEPGTIQETSSTVHGLTPTGVALYTRVSTEDQAERSTIQAQRDFLRSFVQLYGLTIVGEYADDGVTGTIPLSQRPDGRRLLQDVSTGRFNCVLVYRVDRLGRSLTALLDAHAALSKAGITIRSATEPFDTSTPIGTFLFQLLGSLAELEKSTIIERMTLGRDRVARTGRWTGGPIPFGYDLDDGGHLVVSARMVQGLSMTEAEVVHEVFRRIAEGSTVIAECRRLNALNVPPIRRYGGGTQDIVGKQWLPTRVYQMIANPLYYTGHQVLRSKHGPVERPVPALIDQVLWEQTQTQVQRNRRLPKANANRTYLLRGLITCGTCGIRYVGVPTWNRTKSKGAYHYYRCGSQLAAQQPDPQARCRAKLLSAPWLEQLVWEDCQSFIRNPGEALAEAQRQLSERMRQTDRLEGEQQSVEQALIEKAAERERIMTLFRRGHATLHDVEAQLEAITQETTALRTTLGALQAQQALVQAYEAHYYEAETLLTRLRNRLDDIERNDEFQLKRQVIEILVAGIRVDTEGTGRGKQAHVTISYTFTPTHAVHSSTEPARTPRTWSSHTVCKCACLAQR